MRKLTNHITNPVNDKLEVTAVDEPGAGGAHHYYVVTGFDEGGPNYPGDWENDASTIIAFQNGPIAEAGINGLTHEVLLAIVIDRLRSFQAGPHACEENKAALGLCVAALRALKERTKSRLARGVEGTRFV